MVYRTLGDLLPALVDTTDLSRTNVLGFWESNINISFSFFHLWSLLHIVPSAWKALSTNPLATPFTRLTFLWSSTQRDFPPPPLLCVLVAQSYPTLCDPWTEAHQAPLSMGFFRQEYWSGLPFPSPGDLPNPGIKLRSLQADSLPSQPPEFQGVWSLSLI